MPLAPGPLRRSRRGDGAWGPRPLRPRSSLAARARSALAVSLVAGAWGCVEPSAEPRSAPSPSLAEWRHARARLADLERRSSGAPRTLKISLRLREPFSGRVMEARGAVAVAPPDALRMVLLGPGGTTALDLWTSGDRFRFAVPALDLLRRGDASTPRAGMRGLPVDFLRWWLLRPFGGALLWYAREAAADRFLLRDGRSVVDLRVDDAGPIVARRTTFGSAAPGEPAREVDEETVAAERLGCGVVRYRQASTHLEIVVTCEGEEPRAPKPRAFVDPDAPEEAPPP